MITRAHWGTVAEGVVARFELLEGHIVRLTYTFDEAEDAEQAYAEFVSDLASTSCE